MHKQLTRTDHLISITEHFSPNIGSNKMEPFSRYSSAVSVYRTTSLQRQRSSKVSQQRSSTGRGNYGATPLPTTLLVVKETKKSQCKSVGSRSRSRQRSTARGNLSNVPSLQRSSTSNKAYGATQLPTNILVKETEKTQCKPIVNRSRSQQRSTTRGNMSNASPLQGQSTSNKGHGATPLPTNILVKETENIQCKPIVNRSRSRQRSTARGNLSKAPSLQRRSTSSKGHEVTPLPTNTLVKETDIIQCKPIVNRSRSRQRSTTRGSLSNAPLLQRKATSNSAYGKTSLTTNTHVRSDSKVKPNDRATSPRRRFWGLGAAKKPKSVAFEGRQPVSYVRSHRRAHTKSNGQLQLLTKVWRKIWPTEAAQLNVSNKRKAREEAAPLKESKHKARAALISIFFGWVIKGCVGSWDNDDDDDEGDDTCSESDDSPRLNSILSISSEFSERGIFKQLLCGADDRIGRTLVFQRVEYS